MATIPLQQAAANLSELIHGLSPGEELVITENDRPVARLIAAQPPSTGQPRRPGTLRGTVLYMSDDFDAPLEDFREYME